MSLIRLTFFRIWGLKRVICYTKGATL